jgi:CHAD domain-containing protein
MKKIRGALRLIRYSVPNKTYKTLNNRYRDLSRQFATARKASVFLTTLAAIQDNQTDMNLRSTAAEALQANHKMAYKEVSQNKELLPKMRTQLQQSLQDMDTLSFEGNDFELFYKGIKRVYTQGKKALKLARASTDGVHFHDWRKRVKYLWYQMRLLQEAWPAVMKGYAKSLDKLSDHLGLEHDLFDLKNKLQATQKTVITSQKEIGELIDRIDKNRSFIQDSVWKDAEKHYFESPNRFARRIGHYWDVAHANCAPL